jgi:TetR/AcrR family transcriptional regulator, transcriptional repressor of aconitase
MTESRMTGEERRASIAKAVLPLFAKKGFANTTTKQLAEAAGISEALIYKHFPSKESLYAEIRNLGCQGNDAGLEKLSGLEPSTSTLIHIVYYLMRALSIGRPGQAEAWEARHRLVLNSCLEDGAFPRYLFENHFACCVTKVEASLEAALAAGDLVEAPVPNRTRLLFAHHLASMIAVMHLPSEPVVDYRASREELLHGSVWFALRGMGLTDEALKKYYHPKALSVFFGIGAA